MTSILLSLGILASASVAAADDHGRWRGERQRGGDRAGDATSSWIPLSPQNQLARGDVFDVRTRQRFRQVRLQNQTGRTYVRSIEVVFQNGQRQRIQINRTLVGNHDMVEVDLPGDTRRIDRIVVEGRSRRSGSYQLYAM